MPKSRIMDQPEDFKKLGVNPDVVELWEDGRRDDGRRGSFEWWYFDALFEDGTKAVITFFPKIQKKIRTSGDYPFTRIDIALPDGSHHAEDFTYPAAESYFSKETCDVKIGPHSVKGDLKEYAIKISPINGLGADLKLVTKGKPWRPGTAYFSFGDKGEQYFTWLCVVPKGDIAGTITINGEKKAVKGFGYHDHQWGNIMHMFAWNQWIWARQNFGDYNLVLFDLVTNRKFGYQHYPLCFLQDNDGNLLFENTGGTQLEVLEEYFEKETKRNYPRHFRYAMENSGKKLQYSIMVKEEIEVVNYYGKLNVFLKSFMSLHGLRPTYIRYEGIGKLTFSDGRKEIKRESNFIYEMLYAGRKYIKGI